MTPDLRDRIICGAVETHTATRGRSYQWSEAGGVSHIIFRVWNSTYHHYQIFKGYVPHNYTHQNLQEAVKSVARMIDKYQWREGL